jgi:hypothetical protein
MKNPDADIMKFLEKHSYFHKSSEDIVSIFNSIKDPEKFI